MTSTVTPTVTLTQNPTPIDISPYDLFPSGGDQEIDARDLLEFIKDAQDQEDLIFGYSAIWKKTSGSSKKCFSNKDKPSLNPDSLIPLEGRSPRLFRVRRMLSRRIFRYRRTSGFQESR
jgi:hypothetical protein